MAQQNKKKNEIDELKMQFPQDCDVDNREFKVGSKNATLFFIECLIDKKLLTENVISPILENAKILEKSDDIVSVLEKEILTTAKLEKCNLEDAVNNVLAGFVVLAIEGEKEYIAFPLQGWETRAIAEPPTSSVLKGPREGFVEDININLSMIRRRLRSTDLRIKNKTLGRKSQTKVALVYLDSVVDPKVLAEVEDRLDKIDIDGVTASYYVESLLRNNDSKLFRQAGSTEKPDIAMSKILEGRVAIVVDGTPIVITVPFIFLEDLQSSDDYYMHPARATFVRFVRLFGIMIAILLPGLYVALESFHYRLLPIDFLVTVLSSIEGISFPPLIEILVVIFLFEILNEASIRMPKYLGMALSIVGALILGDTAVQAGLITPPSIMIIAVSGICIYILPDQSPITSILRVLFTLIGGFAGFFGLLLGFIFLTAYLVSITNFGAPLMAPFAPSIKADKKDGIIKSGVSQMITRPLSFPNRNRIRQTPRTKALKEDFKKSDPSVKKAFNEEQNSRKNKKPANQKSSDSENAEKEQNNTGKKSKNAERVQNSTNDNQNNIEKVQNDAGKKTENIERKQDKVSKKPQNTEKKLNKVDKNADKVQNNTNNNHNSIKKSQNNANARQKSIKKSNKTADLNKNGNKKQVKINQLEKEGRASD